MPIIAKTLIPSFDFGFLTFLESSKSDLVNRKIISNNVTIEFIMRLYLFSSIIRQS